MEAASRPNFEPLADLPVEEPMGMAMPAPVSAPAAAAAAQSAPVRPDPEEDLLSHGALLDMGVDSPVPPTASEARPDTALIPTLGTAGASSGELLDPEVLLGASEPGAAARFDGTNGVGTLARDGTGTATAPPSAGLAGSAPAVATARGATNAKAPTARDGSVASVNSARASTARTSAASSPAPATRKPAATPPATAATAAAKSASPTSPSAPAGNAVAGRAGATLPGASKPTAVPPSGSTATTGTKKVIRPTVTAAGSPATGSAAPASPFQEVLPDLPVELMDDPLAVAAPPPGMVVPTFPTPSVATAPASTLTASTPTDSGLVPLLGVSVNTPSSTFVAPPTTSPSSVAIPASLATTSAAPTPPAAPAINSATPVSPTSAAAAAAAANPAMDRDFIARNQIVERYLSGRLPLKGATDFEKFCKDNPTVLDELGLPERVNAGLRLLEASGKPEPWQEKSSQRFWSRPQFVVGLVAAVVVLGTALAFTVSTISIKEQRIAKLEKQAAEHPLNPATNTRVIRLVPSHEAASNTPAVVIGGEPTELVDFKIDENRSAYKTFRVTIDRMNQGRVAVLHNLVKDSNGHLRIALNSSALGPGNYQLTIEGLSWRGDAEPDSWVTIGIQR